MEWRDATAGGDLRGRHRRGGGSQRDGINRGINEVATQGGYAAAMLGVAACSSPSSKSYEGFPDLSAGLARAQAGAEDLFPARPRTGSSAFGSGAGNDTTKA